MKDPFKVTTSYSSSQAKGLEWDESAADFQATVKEGVFDTDRIKPELTFLSVILLIGFAVLIIRIFSLQIVQGQNFSLMSEENRLRRQVILAPRGLIKDRNGEVLVQNSASFNLVAVPFDLPKETLDEELDKLSTLFDFDRNEAAIKLEKAGTRSLEPIIIKQDLKPEESILFETKATEFPGFSIQKIPVRDYLNPLVFSHTVGYTGLLNSEEALVLDKSKYGSIDFTGKTGIEKQYEKYLHGINGENLIEVDASGKLLSVLGEKKPVPGQTLKLNIDAGLQQKLFADLTKNNPKTKAVAVAINPKNGEVLALLSLPGFNNNLFAHGIKTQEYQELLNDKTLPLFNRSIAGTYPPGSTVKPMVALAALEEKTVTESTVVVDRGVLVIPNQFDPSIAYNFVSWKRDGLGPVNVYSAIAKSSDIYFYILAGGHPSSPIPGLGAEKLAEYYRKFNLDKLTGIDIQGEKPGVVADPAWKSKYFKNDPILSKWYLGDTYHVGIGQGDMLTTPLQVALWTAIIANDGVGYKPKILSEILDEQGKVIFKNEPEIIVEKFASEENLRMVQEGMRQTVEYGSGVKLLDLPFMSAGKTGTSQFDGSDPSRTHAWFTAYAPFDDPEIVITVLVEAGGEGHAAAVPVVKEALKWWYENK
jgi:penicillin-binding protein 2